MLALINAGWSKLHNYFNKLEQATVYITAIIQNLI